MRPFTTETGIAAPLLRANIDTDQIIPKQFLKRIERTGYGDFLFNDWRYHEDGSEVPGFVLNQTAYHTATILVAGRNFGCGSSREHAVWALMDYGFRTVIAPSFGDIFRSNAAKMGLLTVDVDQNVVDELGDRITEEPGTCLTVDLEHQRISCREWTIAFAIDPGVRTTLLEGLDDIALTLQHDAAITAYEARRPAWMPRLREEPAAS
jgi:3-isopropylmalate/(R)-2-methylmalate dehydratase small subunit